MYRKNDCAVTEPSRVRTNSHRVLHNKRQSQQCTCANGTLSGTFQAITCIAPAGSASANDVKRKLDTWIGLTQQAFSQCYLKSDGFYRITTMPYLPYNEQALSDGWAT